MRGRPRHRLRRARTGRAGALIVVAFVATGCSETKQDIFHPSGRSAEQINTLQVPVFIAAGVVGLLVAAVLAYVLYTGHRRGSTSGEPDPEQVHGNFAIEITWTVLPFVILVVVAIFTLVTLLRIGKSPADAVTVNVYGHQWWWSYEYDLDEDGTPEIVTANELVIPVDRPVNLEIGSRDVIHSFWIPALAGTRDAVPGRTQTLQMRANEVGEFDGQCKEFCGLSHANMRARAVVLSAGDWDDWVRDQQEEAATPAEDSLAGEGLAVFEAKCASCHRIGGVNEFGPEGVEALVAGHAPDLTHLMSRKVFASAQFQLWVPNANGNLEFNRNQLEAWLRNPEALLPMAADEGRGMPNLALPPEELDSLVAYLETLGPYPDGAIPPTTPGA